MDKPIAGAHITDEQVAHRVRILMRDDLSHEAVLVMARDRILNLAAQKAILRAAIQSVLDHNNALKDNYKLPKGLTVELELALKNTK